MKRNMILSTILGTMIGAVGGSVAVGRFTSKDIAKWRSLSDKHLALFQLMNEWMRTKQEGKVIKEYFERNEYKSVAIYGLSYVWERLLDELQSCGLEVKYGIDRNADSIYLNIDMYSPEDNLPEADVVVVTAVSFFDEIYNNLVDKVTCPIVSFEDILYEIS